MLADQVELHRVVFALALLRVLEVEFADAVFSVGLEHVGDVVEFGDGDVAAVGACGGVAGVVLCADAQGDDGW